MEHKPQQHLPDDVLKYNIDDLLGEKRNFNDPIVKKHMGVI